ncbi:hypothetical protein Tco_0489860 [Tanacetum coccineum]
MIPNSQGRRVIPFDHFINNDIEYLSGGVSSRKYTTYMTKTKAADYGIIVVTKLQIVEWHNYKHLDWITVRRDDEKLYKFKEGYLKRLCIQDSEDMLLLLVQGKLTNLTVEECLAFNVSLRMFTRSIAIQRRVEDLQLGVESYQKKLNLTKPDTYRSDLKEKEVYSAYSNPRGFIYQNKDKKNRLMRIDELHKFSDGTLNDVWTALNDCLKGIRMQYLPQTIWRQSDRDKARAMIQAIDKQLNTRRIMRSLEKFVGGRPSNLAMPSCEQLNVVNHSETEITSDSNIIPYSQYLIDESQHVAVQNSNSSAQQDALILSEQVKVLKEGQNVDLVSNNVSDSCAQSIEFDLLKQTLSEHLIEKKSLMQTNSVNSAKPTLSSRPTNVEVQKELPKVSMVNTSLKKLKHHLVGFDVAVEQHRLESKTFEVKMNQVLNENERLLEQVINKDIVNIIVNSSVDNSDVNVCECEKCLKLETELQTGFIEKEIYNNLFKSFTTLEKHCIYLEVDTQHNQEIFQRGNSVSDQSAPSFDQLFEINELKAQSQEKDTVTKKLKKRIKSLSGKMNEDKIKKDLEEIETINIELDHRVSNLIAENEHLKQTYKQLYDSIKPARIRSKEKSLKDELRKLKGKALVDNAITKHTIDPEMLKIDVEPITPKLLNKKTAHSAYIKHTQEEATVLRDLVEHVKSKYPLDH